MIYFLQQYWFPIFIIFGILDWVFSLNDATLEARDAQEAEDDEWYAHPMNKDGMNYKG
jgi:hypothetical protein